MAIIKQYHKETDTTYVYESVSYWDSEKGQSRSNRKLLGKLDPETGEIVPTGKRGRKKKEPTAEETSAFKAQLTAVSDSYMEQIRQQKLTIRQQEIQINDLNRKIAQLETILSKARAILNQGD
jgi:hypothetical protein